ncbi:NAD(P)-dependent oxidoreductase [Streptomyces sp. NPDC050388]|uniref:NAD(P)-dependent oxidoreductase n=1 Tax=Streptomyces sp. NPDC050388 TaxID=3155781 RepID=UPI003448C875
MPEKGAAAVGVIGLGAMGSAFVERLVRSGHTVVGFDTSPEAMLRHAELGGLPADSAAEVARHCGIVITSLATVAAVREVVDAIATVDRPEPGWVVDTNTLSPEEKSRARDALVRSGWRMLDCAVSGHPNMLLAGTATFYISGRDTTHPQVDVALSALAEDYVDLGDFGNAAIAKLVINHLVICHDAATAEAMSLAAKAGMSRKAAYDAIVGSAGSSRIFEIRGRMMVDRDYPKGTMYDLIVDKDGPLIAEMARRQRRAVPLFAAAYQTHVDAMGKGWDGTDPATIVEMLDGNLPPQ